MNRTTLFLIRHAEAEGNAYRRIHGRYDSAVTPRGRSQIRALRERFLADSPDVIYCSGLARSRQTAAALCNPDRILTDPRFLEIALGPWEDVPFGWLERYHPQELNRFSHRIEEWSLEGAEPYSTFTARFLEGLREAASAHPGKKIAIVTHGGVLRAALGILFPDTEPGYADNTSVTALEWDNGVFRPLYFNDASHLTPEISTLAHQNWWRDPTGAARDEDLWFRPVAPEEGQTYIDFRRDAWSLIYGDMRDFDGSGFLADARRGCGDLPEALSFAMDSGRPVGVIQLDLHREEEHGAGYIPFIYLLPEYRGRGLGLQLLGHAVSVFRARGRTAIRLSVAPSNEHAIRFYTQNGFRIIRQAKGRKRYALHLMELDIRVEQQGEERP